MFAILQSFWPLNYKLKCRCLCPLVPRWHSHQKSWFAGMAACTIICRPHLLRTYNLHPTGVGAAVLSSVFLCRKHKLPRIYGIWFLAVDGCKKQQNQSGAEESPKKSPKSPNEHKQGHFNHSITMMLQQSSATGSLVPVFLSQILWCDTMKRCARRCYPMIHHKKTHQWHSKCRNIESCHWEHICKKF